MDFYKIFQLYAVNISAILFDKNIPLNTFVATQKDVFNVYNYKSKSCSVP